MTGILAGVVLWSLWAGTVPAAFSACLLAGGVLAVFGRHRHGGVPVIDVYARRSRYFAWPPALKTAGCLGLLALCAASPSPWIPLALAAVLTVRGGGIRFHDYLALLSLPAAFLLLSGLALLWDYAPAGEGIIALPLGKGWLVVTAAAQARAGLVMARALGAVSCLYFLSLSTTMPEILSVLRRAHVPQVMTELAVLIYRYLFVLLSVQQSMKDAAASRLGYGGFARSVRTTGAVYGNLLAASFRRAGACFDAMESRCYDGEIRFLEREKPVTAPAASLAPENRRLLEETLNMLGEQGLALAVATHDVEFAWRWARRILVFHEGSLAADRTPEELFSDEALLSACRLEQPMLFRAARAMDIRPLPRTMEEWERAVSGKHGGQGGKTV